jgi:hypothetical protein
MPNWVTNRLTIEQPSIKLFKETCVDENGEFSFNKVLPIPGCMNIESSGSLYIREDDDVYKFIDMILKFYPDIWEVDGDPKSEEACRNFINKFEQKVKDGGHNYTGNDRTLTAALAKTYCRKHIGYEDWYNWCIDNWGTKWDACDIYDDLFDADGFLEFSTAWSMPNNIYARMAELGIQFRGSWADEDIGNNCGMFFTTDDGELVIQDAGEITEDTVAFSIAVQGYEDLEEYYDGYLEDDPELYAKLVNPEREKEYKRLAEMVM